MNKIIVTTMMAVLSCMSLFAQQGKNFVKFSAGIVAGDAYSIESLPGCGVNSESSNTTFNITYGRTLWGKGRLSLNLNAGLSYSTGSQTLTLPAMDFDYMAPAAADMDNETYRRYTSMSDAHEKISTSELGIPVYLDLDIKLHKRISVYGLVGLRPQVAISSKVSSLDGSCSVYGVYPQYGNLKIDDPDINDFEQKTLDKSMADEPEANSFTFNLMAGAGVRFHLSDPLSLECGIGYEHGMSDRFKCGSSKPATTISADDAPVTYTVAGGRKVRSFTNSLKSDRLSALSISVGLSYRF